MKIVYPKDANGNVISFATREKDVYDENGNSLTDRISGLETRIRQSDAIKDTNLMYKKVQETNEAYSLLTGRANSLQKSVDDLKKSVSDGKKMVAEAITEKGTSTAAIETFDSMKNKISNISYNNVKVDNVYKSDINVYLQERNFSPVDVVRSSHSFTELPSNYQFAQAASVVCNGKIYLIGMSVNASSSDEHRAARNKCFVYNNSSKQWKSIADLPKNGDVIGTGERDGVIVRAVVLNNEIYVAQSSNHFYKYNEAANTWTTLSNLPESLTRSNNISVFNGKIIFIKGAYTRTDDYNGKETISFYSYNGESASSKWSFTSLGGLSLHDTPDAVGELITLSSSDPITAVELSDGLHVLHEYYHFVISKDGTKYSVLGKLKMTTGTYTRPLLFTHNGNLYLMTSVESNTGSSNNIATYLYYYNASKQRFTVGCRMDAIFEEGDCAVDGVNNKLYAFGGSLYKGHSRNCKVYEFDFSKKIYSLSSFNYY